jgi:hypothetical protein
MVLPIHLYDELKVWMAENDIKISPLLSVRQSSLGGTGVFADADLPEDTVLLEVPKEHVLSPVT